MNTSDVRLITPVYEASKVFYPIWKEYSQIQQSFRKQSARFSKEEPHSKEDLASVAKTMGQMGRSLRDQNIFWERQGYLAYDPMTVHWRNRVDEERKRTDRLYMTVAKQHFEAAKRLGAWPERTD